MKELYLMRHAQTLFNVQGRTQGWSDSPLTPKGIDDTLKAGERLRAKRLCFDAFYSSTQERASDTLELLFANQEYSRLKGLKEMNFGAYEGHSDYLESIDKTTYFKNFGGESSHQVSERMYQSLSECLNKHDKVFALSHGAAMHFLPRRKFLTLRVNLLCHSVTWLVFILLMMKESLPLSNQSHCYKRYLPHRA